MSGNVLVPVDGSEASKRALESACETVVGDDQELIVLHVMAPASTGDLGAFAGMTGDMPDSKEAQEHADEILDDAMETCEEYGVEASSERTQGRPDRAIVARAEKDDVELIVMGSHGRDGVDRVLLGSVAEKVVRRSPKSVFIAR